MGGPKALGPSACSDKLQPMTESLRRVFLAYGISRSATGQAMTEPNLIQWLEQNHPEIDPNEAIKELRETQPLPSDSKL